MIARLRRLERVRARQLDRARGEHVRTAVARERAASEERTASAALTEHVGHTVPIGELEHASARIEIAAARSERARFDHERTREHAALAGKAWHRAELALARARAEREAARRRDEQREHDELAARRTR